QEERDTLWRLLHGKDTLSFRRVEREELVRLLMQWLLGPDVAVVADGAKGPTTLGALLNNEVLFQDALVKPAMPSPNPTFSRSNTVAFGKKSISLSDQQWYGALLFGDLVKFVHQAIEWENLLYFLYPYFWGSEAIGREKMLFEHSDPEHERFLRAG